MAGVKAEHADGEPLNPPKRQRIQDTTPASSSAMTQANGASYTPLRGKVYAITGGASGIGLATAQLLSRKGATVCIADIDPEAIKDAEKFFSGLEAPHMTAKVDVSKRTQVDSWVTSIVDKYGRLDGAANVAGVIGKGHGIASVAELDDDEWDKIIGVNLTGTMYCLRAELRNVVDGGSIVNVSSIHGLKGWFSPPPLSLSATSFPPKYVHLSNGPLGFAKHAAYDASKHGIVGLTKAAALENGDREIRVNSVAPGAIYTPLMQKNWDFVGRAMDAPFDDPSAFRRQGTAEETANVIVFLLGPESTFVSGSVYQVDGAWI
ncbi:short chain dehydrogenase family protein [Metarhizium brunneum]